MANETTNFNIGGIDHPVKDPNAYVKPSTGIPKSDLSQEVQDALDEAGSGDGTVTGVKVGSTTYEPTDGVVDLSTPFGGKVDKNGTDSLMTAAEHTKLQNLPDAASLASTYATKNDVADKQDALTSSTTILNINGDAVHYGDSVTLQGAKGDKGDKGDTVVLDPSQVEQFDIINGLNAAAAGNALDAYQGKRLKDQIDYIYARLQAVYAAIGNIAFWDGKPAAATILPNLDWGNPKHTVTLDLDLTNAVVKHNGVVVSDLGTIQVEEYATLTLTVEAESGKALTSVTSQVGTVSQDLSTVTLVMGQSNVTLDITAVAIAVYSISYGTMTNCSVAQGSPTSISGSSVQIQFSVDTGYELSASGITVTNADKSFNPATNVLTISNPTGNVSISATATVSKIKFLRGYYSSSDNIIGTGIATGGTDITSRVTVSQLLHVAPPETPLASDAAIPHMCTFGGVSSLSPSYTYSLFTIENGVRTRLGSYWCSKSVKDNLSIDFSGTGKTSADVIAAYNAGTLYVRSTIFLNTQGTLLMRSDTYAGIRFGDSAFTPSANGGNYEIVEVDETWTAEQLAAFKEEFNNSTHEF